MPAVFLKPGNSGYRIEALDNKVDTDLQISALLKMWNLLRQATRWLLNLPGSDLDIQEMVDRLAPGMQTLKRSMQKTISADDIITLNNQISHTWMVVFPRHWPPAR